MESFFADSKMRNILKGLIFVDVLSVSSKRQLNMLEGLEKMDLVAIRSLFLQEMSAYLAVVETEDPELLKLRLTRIKEIDRALEEKKKTALPKDLDRYF